MVDGDNGMKHSSDGGVARLTKPSRACYRWGLNRADELGERSDDEQSLKLRASTSLIRAKSDGLSWDTLLSH
ncbi:MAG: hypothetical protein ACI8PT_001122 [Gammaproteobacteria bacterium]|jgi:hypothetical protein